jgi:ABC-type nitrate/sulfonate/bicarbonate transport system substrate-binding protein
MQWMVIVANCDVIERDPELVRAVLRACRQSYRYVAKNPGEFAEFSAHLFGSSVPAMQHAMQRERRDMHYDCEIDLLGLELAIDLQRRLGAFSTELQAKDIIDLNHLPTRSSAFDALASA